MKASNINSTCREWVQSGCDVSSANKCLVCYSLMIAVQIQHAIPRDWRPTLHFPPNSWAETNTVLKCSVSFSIVFLPPYRAAKCYRSLNSLFVSVAYIIIVFMWDLRNNSLHFSVLAFVITVGFCLSHTYLNNSWPYEAYWRLWMQ